MGGGIVVVVVEVVVVEVVVVSITFDARSAVF